MMGTGYSIKDGKVRSHISDDSEILRAFEKLSKNLVFNDWKIGTAPGDEIFDSVIRSLVYFPLIVNDELVGMFVAGKVEMRVSFQKMYSR